MRDFQIMLTTSQNYNQIVKDLPRPLKTVASKPAVKRETEYYLNNIGGLKTAADFLENDRLFSYAMRAFGMEDMIYAKAMVRKTLTEGIKSKTALANADSASASIATIASEGSSIRTLSEGILTALQNLILGG